MRNDNTEIKGSISAVGLGPGDPGLLTIKALEVIKDADIVITPKSAGKDDSVARVIVEKAAGKDKNFMEISYPMVRNSSERESGWKSAAEDIYKIVLEGKKVVFTTLGDLSIYSTFEYFRRAWKKIAPDIQIETVPGISSFQAAAAAAGSDLAIGGAGFCVIPLPENIEDLDKYLELHQTVAVMKISGRLNDLIEYLGSRGLLESSSFASHVSMENSLVVPDMSRMPPVDEKTGYLSLVLVHRREN
jgi:precorrin-2/cobalt-factor-2 C20-methyltransferase